MRLFVLIAALLAASVSFAQGAPTEPTQTRYHRTTKLDFSTMSIEGQLEQPDHAYILSKKKVRFRNLIKMRGHFRSEMMESVGEL